MTDYKKINYEDLRARNKYLSFEEVDTRQLAELHQLLEDMQGGLSIWEAMWRFEWIMDIWAFGAFQDSHRHADYQKEERILQSREHILPFIQSDFIQDDEMSVDRRQKSIAEIIDYIVTCNNNPMM